MKRFTKLSFVALVVTIIWTTIDQATVFAQIGVLRANVLRPQASIGQAQGATFKQPTIRSMQAIGQPQASQLPTLRGVQAIQPAQSVQLPSIRKPSMGVLKPQPPAQQLPTFKPNLPTLQPALPTFRPAQPTFKPVIPPVQGFKPIAPPVQPRIPSLLKLNLHVCTKPFVLKKVTPGQLMPAGVNQSVEKAVSGAQVQVVYKTNGRVVASGTTTSHGAFATQLKPGTFKIIVNKTGFERSETYVTLDKFNRMHKIVLKPRPVLQPHPVAQPTLALRVTAPLGLSSALTKRVGGGIIPAGVIPDVDRPVPMAAIKITKKGTYTIVDSGKTDSNGVYTTRLPQGAYAIYVMKTGFVQNVSVVSLASGGLKKHIILKPNPDRAVPVPPRAPRVPLPRPNPSPQPMPGFAPVNPLPDSIRDRVEKAPGIVLISPNGGETLVPGRVHEIRWIEDDGVGLPIISVMKGGAIVRVYDSSEVYGTRTSAGWRWSWTVPRDIEPGDDYKIRLEATVTPDDPSFAPYTTTEMSNDFFTIANEGITIRGPRERDTVYVTQSELLSWTSVGFTGNIRIILCPEGTESAVHVLKESVPSNDRGRWTVGLGEGRGANRPIEPGRYYIRAMSITDHTIYHDTPVFTIALPDLRITAPTDPGYTLRADERQRIAWTASRAMGDYDIELWMGDVNLATIARDVRIGALSHTSTWFPDPPGMTGSFPEYLRNVHVRLVSKTVPWFHVDGENTFDIYYD